MERKNPTVKNEPFVCGNCHASVPKGKTTCRNHCRECLWSLHVDKDLPGDRKSLCKGLMEPIAIISHGKKKEQIVHECTRCHEKKMNLVMEDDNREKIITIMQRQNLEPLPYE